MHITKTLLILVRIRSTEEIPMFASIMEEWCKVCQEPRVHQELEF